MVTLTLLTACLPSHSDYFEETAQSVAALRSALGERKNFSLEWVVCYDGPGQVPASKEIDREIRLERHGGVAVARNMALSQAQGKYFAILDADDLILPEGVSKALDVLEARNYLSWVACNRRHIDGEPSRHQHGKMEWAPCYLAWDWTSPFPFHPSSLVMRTDTAMEVGGWPALAVSEDVGFILEVSELHAGMAIEENLTAYRNWDKQITRSRSFLRDKEQAYHYIEKLLNNGRRRRRDPLISRPNVT